MPNCSRSFCQSNPSLLFWRIAKLLHTNITHSVEIQGPCKAISLIAGMFSLYQDEIPLFSGREHFESSLGARRRIAKTHPLTLASMLHQKKFPFATPTSTIHALTPNPTFPPALPHTKPPKWPQTNPSNSLSTSPVTANSSTGSSSQLSPAAQCASRKSGPRPQIPASHDPRQTSSGCSTPSQMARRFNSA